MTEPFALWLQKVLETMEYFCYDVCMRDVPRTLKLNRSEEETAEDTDQQIYGCIAK